MYLSNSSSHCARESGGIIPETGRHSVILRPDSVRRVTPPTTMTAKTIAEDARSHIPTGGGDSTGSSATAWADWAEFDEKKRGSNGRLTDASPESGRLPAHMAEREMGLFESLEKAHFVPRDDWHRCWSGIANWARALAARGLRTEASGEASLWESLAHRLEDIVGAHEGCLGFRRTQRPQTCRTTSAAEGFRVKAPCKGENIRGPRLLARRPALTRTARHASCDLDLYWSFSSVTDSTIMLASVLARRRTLQTCLNPRLLSRSYTLPPPTGLDEGERSIHQKLAEKFDPKELLVQDVSGEF